MRGCGLFLWYGFPLPFLKRIELIKNAGFDATGVWIPEPERKVPLSALSGFIASVYDSGLALDFAHAPYFRCNKLWSQDPAARDMIFREYISYLDLCVQGRMGTIVFHIVKGMEPPPLSETGIGVIRRLAEEAASRSVRIALENTRHPDYVETVLDRLPLPNLGLCYDASHDLLHSPDPGGILSRQGGRLFCTHLGATDGKTDTHWIPEEGDPLFEILRTHFPRDYDGFLTMEVLPRRVEKEGQATDFVRKAFTSVCRISGILAN